MARVSSALKSALDIHGKEEDIPSRKGSLLNDGPVDEGGRGGSLSGRSLICGQCGHLPGREGPTLFCGQLWPQGIK